MEIRDCSKRSQYKNISLDSLVDKNHFIRKLDEAIDLSFIYDEVSHLYKPCGRIGIDPVVLGCV